MTRESTLIFELWDMFRDYLPANKRSELAVNFMTLFEEYGFDERDMLDACEDKVLASAFAVVFDKDDPEEDF